MNTTRIDQCYRLVQLGVASASDPAGRAGSPETSGAGSGPPAGSGADEASASGAPGGCPFVAFGVNRHGQVVGQSLRADTGPRAFLWTPQHGMRDLNALVTNAPPGLVLVRARRIGDDGAIHAEAQGGGQYLLLEGDGRDEPPVVGPIAVTGILDVGQPLVFRAHFTDVDRYQVHRATWAWGDGMETRAVVDEERGAGSAHAGHVYQEAGIYTVALTVRDSGGQCSTVRRRIAVGARPRQAVAREGAAGVEGAPGRPLRRRDAVEGS